MQNKTVYLAGKITGDPYYRYKFYDAARKLEAAGFAVVNPATLPSEGFEYEAYIRMSSAMLDECSTACFLPDWKDSNGAMYEFGRATARGIEIFMYAEWLSEQQNKQYQLTAQKTDKLVCVCQKCGRRSIIPAKNADGKGCEFCNGYLLKVGYALMGGGKSEE